MKKLVLLLVICVFFTACGEQQKVTTEAPKTNVTSTENEASSESEKPQNKYFVEFTDSTGETVTLNKKPEKAAILFASYAEIWKSVGGEVAITVGDAVERGFAPADAILVNEGSGHKVDIETIVAAEPDFVVITADYAEQVEAAAILKEMGIPVAEFREEDFSDYLKILEIFGRINENASSYATLGETVGEKIQTIIDAHKSAADGPTYLFIRAGSTAKATKAKTAKNHFACKMIDNIGGVNIVDEDSNLTEDLSVEFILQSQPDFIFFVAMSDEEAAKTYVEKLLTEDGWKDLDAVKNGKTCFLPQDYFNHKPNAKWADAYKYIEDILYKD